jgi:D-serine deaminase-like pyridoxal phosphate-dependent protein
VQAGDAGTYTYVATNAVASATSAKAQLALQPAARVVATPPQNQEVTGGAPICGRETGLPQPVKEPLRPPDQNGTSTHG